MKLSSIYDSRELMDEHIYNILTSIHNNPVTNVISSSGSGKSTILPLKIQEAGNRIVVVVSNEDIVKSLSRYNPEVTYISQNTMKEKIYFLMKKKENLDFTDILMIDEADSSALDITIIMLLWRYAVENKFKAPKLLLVSNTKIHNEMFDINHLTLLNQENNNLPEIRYSNSSDLIKLIYNIYNEIDGDILVFVPSNEINSLMSLKDINIYSSENIDEIYSNKNKKVIISDKLAETTITLSNLKVVIDTLQDIKPRLTLTGGIRYKKDYITKQHANLRASRGAKLVYRLLSLEDYNKLLEYELPEIYSRPLYHTMLEMLEHNIDPFNILTIFNNEELQHNYNLLVKLGVINSLGKVTEIGKFIKKVPLGIRNAVALYKWLQTGYPVYPDLVLLTMIDSFDSYFLYPLKSNDNNAEYNLELLNHRKKYFNPFEENLIFILILIFGI